MSFTKGQRVELNARARQKIARHRDENLLFVAWRTWEFLFATSTWVYGKPYSRNPFETRCTITRKRTGRSYDTWNFDTRYLKTLHAKKFESNTLGDFPRKGHSMWEKICRAFDNCGLVKRLNKAKHPILEEA